ncbi:MAG: protein phosphatase 2C domain-containing protein [Limnoraphis sp. WC205]|nr:protein phosphatase 2C domain-containing protein [Limnoraphis sp. WC205]
MQNQHDYEKIIREIVQKLSSEDLFKTLSLKWNEIRESHQEQNQIIDEVVKSLQEKLPEIKLQIPNHSNLEEEIDKFSRKLLNSFFQDFSQYHSEQLSQIRNLMELKIKAKIREVLGENLSPNHSENTRDLSQNSPPQQSLTNPESQQPNHSSNFGGIVPFQPEEIQSKTSQQQPEQLNRQASENLPIETTVDAPWEYNSLPQNEPAPHSEFDFKAQETPDKLKLIGARVRGKMHKHNGTNCDDWFEFKVSENWTIIAVSDGAGSKKLSRLGAKVSCQAAVQYLSEILKNCTIRQRETTEILSNDLQRKPDWSFVGQDFNEVQTALHIAVKKAYEAVKAKADECYNLTDYYQVLNHKRPQIKDFSATLLLAVHTLIKVAEESYSLVWSCQVGDGAIAAISQEGNLKLLGKADSGEHGGETEFLTSENKIKRENLIQNTFVFPGKLKALMVMTDGVADDYFPLEPRILELYGDLILNQVIPIRQANEIEINSHLRHTRLGNLSGIQDIKYRFRQEVKRLLANDTTEPKIVEISSLEKYAQELHRSPSEVVKSPALLSAGIIPSGMSESCRNITPEEKLKIWLDSYYKRGSFDDRTLVILYREDN